MIHNKSALRFLFAVVALIATVSAGQTTVKADQGKPGNQGPWPVTCANCAGADGGATVGKVAYRPEPQTLVYIPAPYQNEAAGSSGRVGAHVAVGGMMEGDDDAGYRLYNPLPIGIENNLDDHILSPNNLPYALRIGGGEPGNASVRDHIFPIRTTNNAISNNNTAAMVGGQHITDDGSGNVLAGVARVGYAGSIVIDNQCITPSNVAMFYDGGLQTLPNNVVGRRFIQACNDPRNTSTSYWTCSETGTPTTTITDPGDTIFPGDCVTYWVSDSVSVQCISNAANTVIQTKECF